MEKVAGDEATGNAGAAVTPAPSVRVTDAEDRPVPDVEVTFEIVDGQGTITGAVVETNSDGVATVGAWLLGTLGDNSLEASAGTLLPVTFSATALCPSVGSITLGGQVSGALAAGDCRYSDGYFTDRYTFTLAAATTVLFTQNATVFDPFIELHADNRLLALNDNVSFPSDLNSAMRVVLPPGTYQLGASSGPANQTGAYTLGAQTATSAMGGCDAVFVLAGITADQELDETDCLEPPEFYFEVFLIFMEAGRSYTITVSSSVFETYLTVGRATSSGGLIEVQADEHSDGMNSRLVYTATADDLYVILASSGAQATSGAYRLTIQ